MLALLAGSLVLSASVVAVSAQQDTPSTARAGVYTAEQARRGETLYGYSCKDCHGSTLVGGSLAPPLVGKEFIDRWKDIAVGDLVDRISSTMPSSMPGSLTMQEYADAVAYILSVNKYPAGATELPTDSTRLQNVKMAEPPQ
jgi:S-disulfanyl-L-cysteine oxidoreductase SoxD